MSCECSSPRCTCDCIACACHRDHLNPQGEYSPARDEENRRLAQFVGYTFGDDGLCIEPTGHYNVPVPDFYTDEAANALLLEKMPDPVLWKSGPERPDWVCHPRHFRHGTQNDYLIVQHPDRKTAVAEAALLYLEDQEAQK